MKKIDIDSKTKLNMIIKYEKPLIDLSVEEVQMIIELINEKYTNNYIMKFIKAGYYKN